LEGLLIGFVYILGMVFPLFVIAVAWEKYQTRGENPFQGRVVSITVLGHEFSAHSTKVIAGVMFFLMGVVNILVGLTGTMIPAPGSAVVGLMQAQLQRYLVKGLSSISVRPELLVAIIALLSVTVLLIGFRFRGDFFDGKGNPK
jgi:hypothetical protein